MSSHAECVVITAALDRSELENVLDRAMRELQRSGVLGELDPKAVERTYRPGPAARLTVTPDDARYLRFAHACVVRLGDGALGRGVFGAGESTGEGTRCPSCARLFDLDVDRSWGQAIDDWWRGGRGDLTCAGCGVRSSITTWPSDRPIGLGYACLEWQEWPPFDEGFVATLKDVIGHPILMVHQHL